MQQLLRHPTAWVPIVLSLAVLGMMAAVLAATGVDRGADEGTPAHIFQLWMLLESVGVANFAARWLPRELDGAVKILALQVGIALLPIGIVIALGL